METRLIYTPEEVRVSATEFRYLDGDRILSLEIEQVSKNNVPGHGGRFSVQGNPADMAKLLNVLGRVLRHPEIHQEKAKVETEKGPEQTEAAASKEVFLSDVLAPPSPRNPKEAK